MEEKSQQRVTSLWAYLYKDQDKYTLDLHSNILLPLFLRREKLLAGSNSLGG